MINKNHRDEQQNLLIGKTRLYIDLRSGIIPVHTVFVFLSAQAMNPVKH